MTPYLTPYGADTGRAAFGAPGAGRPGIEQDQPGVLAALEALVDPLTRGDPTSPLRWTCKSRAKLAAALTEQGWRVSSTARGIRHVVEAGGRLIVRVNTGSLPLHTAAGRPFDLLAAVSSVRRPGAARSWATTVAAAGDDGGPPGEIAGRVCVLRKSAEAIRLAHQKIRRDAARKGNQVQPATGRFAKYVIVFTIFPEPPFSAADVLEWYRLRWQVELVFKRFKSLAQLGHLPKYDDDSAKAWLYGKLFVALLVEKLLHHARAISPWGYDVPAPAPPQRAA